MRSAAHQMLDLACLGHAVTAAEIHQALIDTGDIPTLTNGDLTPCVSMWLGFCPAATTVGEEQ